MSKKEMYQDYFTPFPKELQTAEVPEKFTFPFYYQAHPLAVFAAKALQNKLVLNPWGHNFGLDPNIPGMVIGKMFGVLVVKDGDGIMGYLSAFSGKLAESNQHEGFVPTVYDMLQPDDYYKQEEKVLNGYNAEIKTLETDPTIQALKSSVEEQIKVLETKIETLKNDFKAASKIRKQLRKEQENLLGSESVLLLREEHKKVSLFQQFQIKEAQQDLEQKKALWLAPIEAHQQKIKELKKLRKEKSKALQNWLFQQYRFLSANGEWKDLNHIFESPLTPPAGAGECAAPKLLQFAFEHNLQPICMAEFWWGASPKSEVRQHQQYYPACRSKCEPILGHMLQGLNIDENPMLKGPEEDIQLEIIFEDADIIAVHKPAEFLSVPGKNVRDSVQERMEQLYPEAKGHMIVHRLDMSTSGIMLLAKNKEAHKNLQHQFISRKTQKRYVALLDGVIEEANGTIDLPLRVDLDRRPMQLVCYEHGKPALTTWERIEVKNGRTLVYFYPHTGRTHQLRVHAAHQKGLNCPIVGDDIYGTPANRLHLHAEQLIFMHPRTKEEVILEVKAEYY